MVDGCVDPPQVFICVKLAKLCCLLFCSALCTWRMSDVYKKIMQNAYKKKEKKSSIL